MNAVILEVCTPQQFLSRYRLLPICTSSLGTSWTGVNRSVQVFEVGTEHMHVGTSAR